MLKFSHLLYLPLYHMDSPTYKGHNDLTYPYLHRTLRKQLIYIKQYIITFNKINLRVTFVRGLNQHIKTRTDDSHAPPGRSYNSFILINYIIPNRIIYLTILSLYCCKM